MKLVAQTLLAGAALTALGAGAANAASESFTATIPTQTTPFSVTFNLPKFNPVLGTLTGVTITGTASATATLELDNGDSVTVSYASATLTASLTATGPGPTTLINDPTITQGPGSVATMDSVTFTKDTSDSETVSVPSANWGDYTGIGNTVASFEVVGDVIVNRDSSNPLLFVSGTAEEGAVYTITYDYTPVPEPGSMLLLASGVFGIATLRRRSAG